MTKESKQIKCYCGHTTYCDCLPIKKSFDDYLKQNPYKENRSFTKEDWEADIWEKWNTLYNSKEDPKKETLEEEFCHYSGLPSPLAYIEETTLEKVLENEPYFSDDFQIGPDGAYEHIEYSIPIYENGIKTEYTVDGIIGDEKYYQLLELGNGKDLPDMINTTTNNRKL